MRPTTIASLVASSLFGLLVGMATPCTAHAADPSSRYYAQDTEGIFWFLHISDLHIDPLNNSARKHLTFALGEAVDVIQPIAVFASGDLVDGSVFLPTSGQDKAEWDLYATLLSDANVTPEFFFDMPGNHDTYGDQGLKHYLERSLQGSTTGSLFSDTVHTTSLGDYYFVALNSSGTYGTPFTFGNPQFTNVPELEAGLETHASAQLVFAFAHHHLVPHGATDAQTALGIGGKDDPPGNVSEVMALLEDAGAFYLHGHVHQYKESLQGKLVTVQLANLAGSPNVDRSSLDAWDKTKFESNIGVGIIDHNAFIYRVTDTTHPWPFVVITAPVDINLQGGGIPAGSTAGVSYEGDFVPYGEQANPYAYDVCLARKDNPVRAVVLSKDPVSSVRLMLDTTEVGPMTAVTSQPGLYAAQMDTTGLEPGVHSLTVLATTASETRGDSIQVNFVKGPCDDLPDAGVDAPDSEPDASDSDSDITSDAQPDAGSTSDATQDSVADADTTDAADTTPPPGDTDDDGGCSCRVGANTSNPWTALALSLIALAFRRRRTTRSPLSSR